VSKTYVLDASAVLDFVEDGPGAERVQQLFEGAARSRAPVLMSAMNWGEVFYQSWQKRGEEPARKILADLERLPIEVIPVDLSQALKAGELKAVHKIPFVDSVAAALAALRRATLVTSDRDFEKLGRHFPILWLARQ
jgi:predicted nucleic acid-binding protein